MAEYIEREALEEKLDRRLQELRKKYGPFDRYTDGFDEAVDIVDGVQPAADVVEIVRCRECKHRYTIRCALWYGQCGECYYFTERGDDFSCSYGERKDGRKGR